MKSIIKVNNLTKDYGHNRGIFDVSFDIKKGETFGIVGTNGSGKTTIIRHIMGFIKPQQGSATVNDFDAWHDASKTKQFIGYVPGEIAFPDLNNGITFLKNQAELLGMKDMAYAQRLIERLQLDPSANLRRMSKGMKQKTAIVAAFMADKDILILDEPTTGLDPLMRESFLDIIREEKAKGKTILMSNQSFDELEQTCDRVALILDGKIVDIADIHKLKNPNYKQFKVEFIKKDDYIDFKKLKYKIVRDRPEINQVIIKIKNNDTNKLLQDLKNRKIKYLAEVQNNLEKHFKEILLKNDKKEKKV